jgi:hypothetical protein
MRRTLEFVAMGIQLESKMSDPSFKFDNSSLKEVSVATIRKAAASCKLL